MSFGNSDRAAYSDLNLRDRGQSLYPMSTVYSKQRWTWFYHQDSHRLWTLRKRLQPLMIRLTMFPNLLEPRPTPNLSVLGDRSARLAQMYRGWLNPGRVMTEKILKSNWCLKQVPDWKIDNRVLILVQSEFGVRIWSDFFHYIFWCSE